MKVKIVPMFLFLFFLSILPVGAFQGEPEGAFGIRWGAQIQMLYGLTAVDTKLPEHFELYSRSDGYGFLFYQNQFAGISKSFPEDFDTMRKYLVEAHGPYTQMVASSKTGAVAIWAGDTTTIRLTQKEKGCSVATIYTGAVKLLFGDPSIVGQGKMSQK